MKTFMRRMLIGVGLILAVCCVVFGCIRSRRNPDKLVKNVIKENLGEMDYSIEKVPVGEPKYFNNGNGEVEEKWDVYVPDYDLTFHMWYLSWDAIISTGYKFETDFSRVFLTYFMQKYEGELTTVEFIPTGTGKFLDVECRFVSSYSDELSLQKCLKEIEAFCRYVSDKCEFKFETEWSVYRECRITAAGKTYDINYPLVLSGSQEDENWNMMRYYEEIEEKIDRRDISRMIKLYLDPECFYTRKTKDELVLTCYQGKHIQMPDGTEYANIHSFPDELTLAEFYTLLRTLEIPVEGSAREFSFSHNDMKYTFSYDFYDGEKFYYLENDEAKDIKSDGFFCSYELIENLIGIILKCVS